MFTMQCDLLSFLSDFNYVKLAANWKIFYEVDNDLTPKRTSN